MAIKSKAKSKPGLSELLKPAAKKGKKKPAPVGQLSLIRNGKEYQYNRISLYPDAEILDIILAVKSKCQEKADTKAVIRIIREYDRLSRQEAEIKQELREISEKYRKLIRSSSGFISAFKELEKTVSDEPATRLPFASGNLMDEDEEEFEDDYDWTEDE